MSDLSTFEQYYKLADQLISRLDPSKWPSRETDIWKMTFFMSYAYMNWAISL
jgi:hypothetical protein